jgi:nitric oxide reductase subunit C
MAMNNRLVFGTLFVAFIAYSSQVYTSGTTSMQTPPISDEARHGQQLFQDYNCIACHQFYGLGGYMGPDLTNVISKRGDVYSAAFIKAGTATMPNFGLAPDEVSALVEFLTYVDKTGTYPPEEYEVRWTGVVEQADDPA